MPPQLSKETDDEPWSDQPRSSEDAVDEIWGSLFSEASAHGRYLLRKHVLDLSAPESTVSARRKDRLIVAFDVTIREVCAQLFADEETVTMPDGAVLPQSWVTAYAFLDRLEDPPALLVVLETILGAE